jgi:methionyl-tRNA synthetase
MLWGLSLEQPGQILGHPWLLFGDEKMSKSKGNVVYSDTMIEKFGADAVRYYLLGEMPFDRDFSFTHLNFIRKYNADLVNTLSNLVNRTVVMTGKYFGGVIPEPDREDGLDRNLKETVISGAGNYAALMNEYKISDAIGEILAILYRANKYIDETEPWALAKDENDKNKRKRLGAVLYNLLESIRIAGILLTPVIPGTCEKIFAQINTDITGYETAFEFGGLRPGGSVNKAEPVFMRIDEKKMLAELGE